MMWPACAPVVRLMVVAWNVVPLVVIRARVPSALNSGSDTMLPGSVKALTVQPVAVSMTDTRESPVEAPSPG